PGSGRFPFPASTGKKHLTLPCYALLLLALQCCGAHADRVELDPTRAKWTQIVAEIERRIDAGMYPAGTKLPSLLALCSEFGVAQVTARKALANLRDRDVIRVENGIGSFVK
ncbi:MAG TPA: GntR family transcriptional regulator, partial [Streptomyces sp.]|nr:GntR family transcriptional regulator [Streptomyces sp.]